MKKSKKQSHDVVTKKGRDRDDAEISKLEKLMGIQSTKKKKRLPASFRNDGLDCIQPYCCTVNFYSYMLLHVSIKFEFNIKKLTNLC